MPMYLVTTGAVRSQSVMAGSHVGAAKKVLFKAKHGTQFGELVRVHLRGTKPVTDIYLDTRSLMIDIGAKYTVKGEGGV